MKMLVMAILCVGLFFLYQSTIGSVKHLYQLCTDQAIALKLEEANMSCAVKQTTYEDLVTCIKSVQQESVLGSFLYSPIGVESKVNLLVRDHNNECPKNLVNLPKEGLYVSN